MRSYTRQFIRLETKEEGKKMFSNSLSFQVHAHQKQNKNQLKIIRFNYIR